MTPLRVLFVCTGNSARSQMAEALLNAKGQGRVRAESAGLRAAAQVHPLALATLREFGVPWTGHAPRALDGLEHEPWDFVITVCDRAKESCPIFPGTPALAHWSLSDPTEVAGDDAAKREAFRQTFVDLSRRVDLLLSLKEFAAR